MVNNVFGQDSYKEQLGTIWERRCENLTRICEAFSWSMPREAANQAIVDAVAKVFCADVAAIHLMSTDGSELVRITSSNHRDDVCYTVSKKVKSTKGRISWMMSSQEPVVMDYIRPDQHDEIPFDAVLAGYKWAVSFPMICENEVQGMCSLAFKSPLNWDDERDAPYVMRAGRILGVGFSRMEPTGKTITLLALEERR